MYIINIIRNITLIEYIFVEQKTVFVNAIKHFLSFNS